MLNPYSFFFLCILCGLIGFSLIKSMISSDKSKIWSPVTIVCLTMLYYIVLPSFGDIRLYGANVTQGQHLFYFASVLFFICVLIGFSWKQKNHFQNWNDFFHKDNIRAAGIMLFVFAMVCYMPFRGFRTTIWAEDAYMVSERTGLVSYFIDLISLFCASCGLMYIYYKSHKYRAKKGFYFWVVLYFSLVLFIVGGFRYRLVWLILSLATIYHLYPKPRRPNYILIMTVAIVAYLGFAIMDVSRQYGFGIKKDVASEISLTQAQQGAGESVDVICFSIVAIDEYNRNGGYAYFESIMTAILMPLPRSFFPWKPDGEYIRVAQRRTIGSAEGGAACLGFVEGFISFGWFGVILYGLFFGWLSGVFWDNYRRHQQSVGAILLIALYNGFCYQFIARGYLAGKFIDFLYFVIVPFWLVTLFMKIMPNVFVTKTISKR